METASSQPDDIVLSLSPDQRSGTICDQIPIPSGLLRELWLIGEAETYGLSLEEFNVALVSVGAKHNHGLPSGVSPNPAQKACFFRSLHLSEFAIAHACALGREVAWERFLSMYRAPLTQAAIAITGSATLGHDLADSLYSELYGLRQVDGKRNSPLASYSGRGSFLGWLRTTLAQRHVDHYRRTHRESSLDTLDVPAPASPTSSTQTELARVSHAVGRTLAALPVDDRLLLSSYFLDRQTLLQIARVLHVHEATISRRLKRLITSLRKQLLHNLQSGGLSRPAAEEALGTDPRDIEINLRALLQTSQIDSFSYKTASVPTRASDQL